MLKVKKKKKKNQNHIHRSSEYMAFKAIEFLGEVSKQGSMFSTFANLFLIVFDHD